MFCKHKWKLITETFTDSKLEVFINTFKSNGLSLDDIPIPNRLLDSEKKHIAILTCEECGKLKRFITDL